MTTWAIVPVKPLHRGKSRLATVLSVEERAELTQQMFRHVVTTLQSIDQIDEILVVSRDEDIVDAAAALNARVYSEEDPVNLNAALTVSAEYAWKTGVKAILIIPSDLGLMTASGVRALLAEESRVVICPDDKFDGTNAMVVRDLPRFQFRYGEQSFMKHLEEASLNGHTAQVVYDDSLEFDLDTPADWQRYQKEIGVQHEP